MLVFGSVRSRSLTKPGFTGGMSEKWISMSTADRNCPASGEYAKKGAAPMENRMHLTPRQLAARWQVSLI